jgi:hypothetical protein
VRDGATVLLAGPGPSTLSFNAQDEETHELSRHAEISLSLGRISFSFPTGVTPWSLHSSISSDPQ